MLHATVFKIILPTYLMFLTGVEAQAHAQLDHSDPPVGSTISQAPPALTLYFTEAIEPAFSSVQLTDGGGRRMDNGKPRVDRADPRQVQVPLKPLPPGRYTVRWRAVAVDTHTIEGNFSFEVRP
jgi:methionine-rich copper-binding protein CopC